MNMRGSKISSPSNLRSWSMGETYTSIWQPNRQLERTLQFKSDKFLLHGNWNHRQLIDLLVVSWITGVLPGYKNPVDFKVLNILKILVNWE